MVRFALLLLEWGHEPITVVEPEIDPAIEQAVRQSFVACGLSLSEFSPSFDITRTGKLHEVLYHTANVLHTTHSLHTVADVMAFFSREQGL